LYFHYSPIFHDLPAWRDYEPSVTASRRFEVEDLAGLLDRFLYQDFSMRQMTAMRREVHAIVLRHSHGSLPEFLCKSECYYQIVPEFRLVCPPVTIVVAYNTGTVPPKPDAPKAWFVDVFLQLKNGKKTHPIRPQAPDLVSAQKMAIEAAVLLCEQHGVMPPDCILENPQWAEY
jgi:hypothetical protein